MTTSDEDGSGAKAPPPLITAPLQLIKMKEIKDIELIKKQLQLAKSMIGQKIVKIIFYLEATDTEMSEQQNSYGKSLLNGIDVETTRNVFSIGNRYTNFGYGLSIGEGKTNEIEVFQDEKMPIEYQTSVTGEEIEDLKIYWMEIPFEGEHGKYPQEIEINTKNGFLLLSSIEVNNGKINTEFTNELLVIDESENAKKLKLSKFDLGNNGRMILTNIENQTIN